MDDTIRMSLFDEDILMERPVGDYQWKVKDFPEGKSWVNLYRREGEEVSEEPTAKV